MGRKQRSELERPPKTASEAELTSTAQNPDRERERGQTQRERERSDPAVGASRLGAFDVHARRVELRRAQAARR